MPAGDSGWRKRMAALPIAVQVARGDPGGPAARRHEPRHVPAQGDQAPRQAEGEALERAPARRPSGSSASGSGRPSSPSWPTSSRSPGRSLTSSPATTTAAPATSWASSTGRSASPTAPVVAEYGEPLGGGPPRAVRGRATGPRPALRRGQPRQATPHLRDHRPRPAAQAEGGGQRIRPGVPGSHGREATGGRRPGSASKQSRQTRSVSMRGTRLWSSSPARRRRSR